MAKTYEEEKVIPKEEARQGQTGTGLLYMLIGGLILAFVVWGGIEVYGHWIAQETPAQGGNPAPPAQTSTPPAG